MIREISYFNLGATLYIPAIHENLRNVILNSKYENLRSVVICLEDSIQDKDREQAMNSLRQILKEIELNKKLKIFIRPQNVKMLEEILSMQNIYKIDGFSIPKFDTSNISKYLNIFRTHNDFYFMPILETKDIFSQEKLMDIAVALEPFKDRILTIRLGSEDILNLLQLRRDKSSMIYDILPFHMVTATAMSIFKPLGFNISGPVFNNFKDDKILNLEVKKEKEYGIFNKTIIHPKHIEQIQSQYSPSIQDFEIAKRLLTREEAVFSVDGSMYELTTHINWAQSIMELGKEYGTI